MRQSSIVKAIGRTRAPLAEYIHDKPQPVSDPSQPLGPMTYFEQLFRMLQVNQFVCQWLSVYDRCREMEGGVKYVWSPSGTSLLATFSLQNRDQQLPIKSEKPTNIAQIGNRKIKERMMKGSYSKNKSNVNDKSIRNIKQSEGQKGNKGDGNGKGSSLTNMNNTKTNSIAPPIDSIDYSSNYNQGNHKSINNRLVVANHYTANSITSNIHLSSKLPPKMTNKCRDMGGKGGQVGQGRDQGDYMGYKDEGGQKDERGGVNQGGEINSRGQNRREEPILGNSSSKKDIKKGQSKKNVVIINDTTKIADGLNRQVNRSMPVDMGSQKKLGIKMVRGVNGNNNITGINNVSNAINTINSNSNNTPNLKKNRINFNQPTKPHVTRNGVQPYQSPDGASYKQTNYSTWQSLCRSKLAKPHLLYLRQQPLLGAGAFCKVKYGCHPLTGEGYAVKIYQKYKIIQGSARRRVDKEIALLSGIDHPNIIGLVAAYEDKRQIHVVMELMEGGMTLQEWIRKGKCAGREREILRLIVEAVKFIHGRGIAHRDIKPDNVLIAESIGFQEEQDRIGRPSSQSSNIPTTNHSIRLKLIDFGFSSTSLQTSTPCGTPSYMPPQYHYPSSFPPPYPYLSCDIWSLGVLMYCVLQEGRLPFWGYDQKELGRKVCRGEAVWRVQNGDRGDQYRRGQGMVKRILGGIRPQERMTIQDVLRGDYF